MSKIDDEAQAKVDKIEDEAQAKVDIWKYVLGFTELAAVRCAIELGISDVLEGHEGPMALSELSSILRCSPSILYRIMRFLIHRGIFKEVKLGQESFGYAQTPFSRVLTRNGEKSMAALILLESSPAMLAPWQGLRALALGDVNSAFAATHGEDLWHYGASNPAHNKLINEAMACRARIEITTIIDDYPELFQEIGTLVDVGGGDGTTLATLVKSCPWIRGINFDLPHVVSVATSSPGIEHIAGSMFHSVPEADAALLMNVLHDWSDDESIDVLKKCRDAIAKDAGKVIIIEAVLDKVRDTKFTEIVLGLDMVMMAHTEGKERTYKEWADLLNAAGFRKFTVTHVRAVPSVIEAYP